MKHYVVTRGCYSDYHIIAVCSDMKDAEAIVRKFKDGFYRPEIEEYEDGKEIFIENNCYFVRISRSGEIIEFCMKNDEYSWGNTRIRKGFNGDASVYVLAKDEEHAKKIATDRWSQWMARQKGLC